MQYVLNSSELPGWAAEPCSPFEILESLVAPETVILFRKTAEALVSFFSHAELTNLTIKTLNYSTEFPEEFKPGDIVFFVFCPRPDTFQFCKGHIMEKTKLKGEDCDENM